MLRSYLFVPGNQEKMINQAIRSDADAVIIDLEDAVAEGKKQYVREALLSNASTFKEVQKKMIVRINSLETTHWMKDVHAVIQSGITCVMLPKSESAKDVKKIADLIEQERIHDFSIIPLIETAKGVLQSFEIVSAHPCVTRLAFGSVDYRLNIGAEQTEEETELLFARSQLINVSAAAGVQSPIDCPYIDFSDEKGFINSAKRAKQLGMHAKLLIHPKQIALLHDVYAPTEEELSEAYGIVRAFESALADGVSAISYNGKMIDDPVYRQAKELTSKYMQRVKDRANK